MGKTLDSIDDELAGFIRRQHLFFVASAPLDPGGHVNLSPKGLDSFRILAPNRVAYADLTASGNETSAHLLQNGRITFMFCSFEAKPMILRLYGRGATILRQSPRWNEFAPLFPTYPGLRQIILADISRVQTSCGFAIPLMNHVADRPLLTEWAMAKGDEQLAEYRRQKNFRSIDGLPTPLGQQT